MIRDDNDNRILRMSRFFQRLHDPAKMVIPVTIGREIVPDTVLPIFLSSEIFIFREHRRNIIVLGDVTVPVRRPAKIRGVVYFLEPCRGRAWHMRTEEADLAVEGLIAVILCQELYRGIRRFCIVIKIVVDSVRRSPTPSEPAERPASLSQLFRQTHVVWKFLSAVGIDDIVILGLQRPITMIRSSTA